MLNQIWRIIVKQQLYMQQEQFDFGSNQLLFRANGSHLWLAPTLLSKLKRFYGAFDDAGHLDLDALEITLTWLEKAGAWASILGFMDDLLPDIPDVDVDFNVNVVVGNEGDVTIGDDNESGDNGSDTDDDNDNSSDSDNNSDDDTGDDAE